MSKSNKNNNLDNLEYRILKSYPNYKIYENGIVIRIRDGYVMTQRWSAGYLRVSLTNSKKTRHFGVHILVAFAFIPNPKKLPCVDHIDETRDNNHYTNLQWITRGDNTRKHYETPTAERAILQYTSDMKLVKEWCSLKQILKDNEDFRESTILNNLRGARKSAYGFIWQYKIPREKKQIIKPLKGEIFKPIPKFGSNDLSDYKASNKGRIMNKQGLIMKNTVNSDGYSVLNLVNKKENKRKIYCVHKLVAYTFLQNDNPALLNLCRCMQMHTSTKFNEAFSVKTEKFLHSKNVRKYM